MRRFSFNIDLRKDKKSAGQTKPQKRSKARPSADGFEMSSALAEQRQNLRAWPSYQRTLETLPNLLGTTAPWSDEHLAAEYVRIYNVSKQKLLDAAPGFGHEKKLETHCFFQPDGTKQLVSRLLANPHQRVNEIRLSPDGQLVRLYYENTGGELQNLDEIFEAGLLGLEDDLNRFSRFPNYVMRFFLLVPQLDCLESTFRGACYYDPENHAVVTQEAESLTDC